MHDLHARSRLVEYQWSWERWGISLELHGRTWSITWRELGPRSQRLPLVTHYTVIWIQILQHAQGPPAQASTCPGLSEVCQRPSGWSRGGMGEGHVVRWDQNRTFWYKLHSSCLEEEEGWEQSQEPHPNREEWGWKHHALGVIFSKVDRTTAPYGGEDGWGHVLWHFGQQPPSLSMSIEDGSWLGFPAWQWPQPYSKGK